MNSIKEMVRDRKKVRELGNGQVSEKTIMQAIAER